MIYSVALKSASKITESEEFKTLKRILGEQTDNDDFDNLDPAEIKAKNGEKLSSDILQNPSAPYATYRFKLDLINPDILEILLKKRWN